MSRQDEVRLGDIVEAIAAIQHHLTRGDLHDGLVYDAVRVTRSFRTSLTTTLGLSQKRRNR